MYSDCATISASTAILMISTDTTKEMKRVYQFDCMNRLLLLIRVHSVERPRSNQNTDKIELIYTLQLLFLSILDISNRRLV